jgi:polysaccharide biosynthesis/export protein
MMQKNVRKSIGGVFFLIALFTVNTTVLAQEKPTSAAPQTTNPDIASSRPNVPTPLQVAPQDETRRYRIGVGDELEIQVFRHPQYSQAVRVNEYGLIAMPRVDEPIRATCKTENELAEEIKTHYSKYLKQPFVRVFVRNYQSQPVAIIGAVDKPGQLYLNRKMRLMQVLALAGGPNKEAGTRIQVARLGTGNVCEKPVGEPLPEEDLSKLLYSYSLKKTLEGDETANPWLQPGDMIYVSEADKAFVVGNVEEPKTILLKSPRTLSQAIAEAGGIKEATKKKQIFLIRSDDAGNKTKIPVDLVAISQGKAEDPTLRPNDIVEVPVDGTKQAINSFKKAFTNGLPSVLPFLF